MMKRLLSASALGFLALSGEVMAAPATTEITSTVTGVGYVVNSMSSKFNLLGFGGESSYRASSLPDLEKCQPETKCLLPSAILEGSAPASFSAVKDRLKNGDRIDYAVLDGRGETIKRVYLDVRKKGADTSDVLYLNPDDFPAGDVMAFLTKNNIPNKATRQFHDPTTTEYVGYGILRMVIHVIL